VAYLDLAGFKVRTLMASGDVDYVETVEPGFVAARLKLRSSYIDGRLRKRYGQSGQLPFTAPPEIILSWLVAMVTYEVMRKRGFNPQDPVGELYTKDNETAMAELKEAADSKDGLFDLPAVENGDSAVTTGGPLGYAETSPYVWQNFERNKGRAEDAQVAASSDDEELFDG
jgi:hypothetical protein